MRVLALALLLALVAGGWLLWSSGGRSARVAGLTPPADGAAAPAGPARATPVVATPDAVERQPAAVEARPAAAPAHVADPAPAPAPPAPKGLVVRGTVRFSSDRRPAAGARFALHHPEGYVLVEADEEGRFATPPDVAPGVLRPWHLATPGDERLALHLRFASESFPVDVLRGVEQEVSLTLPEGFTALAAAGLVLDQEGDPLEGVEVGAVLGPDRAEWTTTDAAGRFEFHAAPVPRVRLVAGEDLFGDVYEPAAQEVVFGTPDALIRRTETLPRVSLSLEVVDAATGERVPSVLVLGYRLPRLGSYSFHHAPEGLVQLPLTLHPGSRLAVDAPGYRRQHVDPGPLVDASPAGGVHRIALEPGLARTVRVVTAEDLAPCPGARVLFRGAVVGVANDAGLVELDLYGPVEELVFEAEGRAPLALDPADWMAELEAPLVLLAGS